MPEMNRGKTGDVEQHPFLELARIVAPYFFIPFFGAVAKIVIEWLKLRYKPTRQTKHRTPPSRPF